MIDVDTSYYFALNYDAINDSIRYLIGLKSSNTFVFSHNYSNTKFDSCDSLPLEETFNLQNVMKHIKAVLNKDQNHHYYKTFLEKYSSQ